MVERGGRRQGELAVSNINNQTIKIKAKEPQIAEQAKAYKDVNKLI